MNDEPREPTVSETSSDERSALSTEDFTAEGRQRAAERAGDHSTSPRAGEDRAGEDRAREDWAREDWEGPLFSDSDRDELRHRWERVQEQFVDEPKHAVQDADALVAETIQSLAETFSSARGALEDRWSRGDDVSTEDLRITLQQYRSFFNRLLER